MNDEKQEKLDDKKTKRERIKEVVGKSASNGYKPKKDETIEVRGD